MTNYQPLFCLDDNFETKFIKSCYDCFMRKSHHGQGEHWDYCSHPNSPNGYHDIIHKDVLENKEYPDWCPLLKSSLFVRIG